MQVRLHAVAVEFEFMHEPADGWNLGARRGKRRFNEVREWRGLGARKDAGKKARL
jgi:hypothetical protein